jgi:uncharacterized delta-60 repeat protein
LETTFGAGGKTLTPFSDPTASDWYGARSVIAIDDHVVLAAGLGGGDFTVARYRDGVLDPDFGTGGSVQVDFGSGYDEAWAMVRQPDGRIVVAGRGGVDQTGLVVRLEANGTVDTTFGTGGKLVLPLGVDEVRYQLFGVAIVSGGKILLVGNASRDFGNQYIAFARLTPSGALDTGFGDDGLLITDELGTARALVVQPDGRFLVSNQIEDFVVRRYLGSGTLDSSFGAAGRATMPGSQFLPGAIQAGWITALALTPAGKVVGTGEVFGSAGTSIGVARWHANGIVDLSFAGDGAFVVPHPSGVFSESPYAIGIGVFDSAVIAGEIGTDVELTRVLGTGVIDNTFGANGHAVTDFGTGDLQSYWSLAMTPDGHAIAAGHVGRFAGAKFALASYRLYPS